MRKKYLLDTNVLLRHILNDHPILASQASTYFQQAEKDKAVIYITDLSLAELIWVLKSVYHQPINKIYDLLIKLLSHKNIQINNKNLIINALLLTKKNNIAFIDAVNLLSAKQQKILFITFDKKLSKLEKPL